MTSNCGGHDDLGYWADSVLMSLSSFLSDHEEGEGFETGVTQESAPNLPSMAVDPIRNASVCRVQDRLFRKNKSGAKRRRSPNWKGEEKQTYLFLKVEALEAVVGKPDWDYISQGLKRHGFERGAKCCEDLWGTLLKAYRAIREHECFKLGSEAGVSYWDMDEDMRCKNKLPKAFSMEWCKMMERILAAQDKLQSGKGKRKSCRRISQVHKSKDQHECSRLHSNQQSQRMVVDHQPAEMSNPGPKESDETMTPLPLLKEQVEKEVNSALQVLPWSSVTSENGGLMTCLSPLVKHLVQKAVSSVLQPVEDEVIMTVLAPFIKKQVADTLNSSLQPVSSVLQVREENDQEYQERLRAIEEKRQALDLEEMQVKRQRFGQQQRLRRAVPHKHGKDSWDTEGVTPALRGLNLGRDKEPGPGSSSSIGGSDY